MTFNQRQPSGLFTIWLLIAALVAVIVFSALATFSDLVIAGEAQQNTLRTESELLAIPLVVGLLGSWCSVWLVKYVWRDRHPKYEERMRNSTTVILAAVLGAAYAIFAVWMLADILSPRLGYPLATQRAYVGYGVITGTASPLCFWLLLWFILTPLDFKLWKKPAYKRLYELIKVGHRPDVDYTAGSDLTMMTGDETTQPKDPR